MISQLFAAPADDMDSMANRPFGTRRRGRYKAPLLPDESGTKAGGDWVPGGVQSVTNLLDGFEDSRGLSLWEQEGGLAGLALSPSLYEELVNLIHQARAEGVNFARLKERPDLRTALTGGGDKDAHEVSILGRAKHLAGLNEARQAGTNRHTAFEHNVLTGELIGTPAMQEQQRAMVKLLAEHHLVPVPGLAERVVRNLRVDTMGRYDIALLHELTGKLHMADLKTKRDPFRSFASAEGQLATYAKSEWQLVAGQEDTYEDGPLTYVDQQIGYILIMPSDGSKPYLRKADLVYGWDVAQHARRTLKLRSFGASAEHQRWGQIDDHEPVAR